MLSKILSFSSFPIFALSSLASFLAALWLFKVILFDFDADNIAATEEIFSFAYKHSELILVSIFVLFITAYLAYLADKAETKRFYSGVDSINNSENKKDY